MAKGSRARRSGVEPAWAHVGDGEDGSAGGVLPAVSRQPGRGTAVIGLRPMHPPGGAGATIAARVERRPRQCESGENPDRGGLPSCRGGAVVDEAEPGARRPLLDAATVAVGWIGRCLARRQGRLALGALTDEQLKDVGLTRGDVEREIGRRPWD